MKYCMTGKVRYSEIGENGQLTLQALLNYLQDCCTAQGEEIGLGLDRLMEKGICWMLNNWQVVINRLPVLGEEILIETWPYAFRGFFGFRNFTISTSQKEILVYVHSGWTLVDIGNGHPARIPKEIAASYELEPPYPMETAPRKLQIPEQILPGLEVTVTKHFLDTNRHMNNSRYAAIAADLLPEDFEVRELRIEYKKQVMLGEKILAGTAEAEDRFVCVLKNETGEVCTVVEFLKQDQKGLSR